MATTAPTTAPSVKIFSILGKGLKANTAADLEPYLSELKQLEDVEEVHFGANSLGVEACEAIAEVLKGKKSLKVCWRWYLRIIQADMFFR
jgi:Ran GTPase-activating protein 1